MLARGLDLSAAVSDVLIIEDAIIEHRVFAFAAEVCQGIILNHEARSDLSAALSLRKESRYSSSSHRRNSRN